MFRENRKEMSHEIEMIGRRSSKGNTVIFASPTKKKHKHAKSVMVGKKERAM